MNCPLCQTTLQEKPNETFSHHIDFSCPAPFGVISYHRTHYRKYVSGGWSCFQKIEQMIAFPFLAENFETQYHRDKTTQYHCIVSVYQEKRNNNLGIDRGPGFVKAVTLPFLLPPMPKEQLKHRLNTIVTFS